METLLLRKGLETPICDPTENPERKILPPGGKSSGKRREG
jgi:hypothetical protein